MFGVILKATNSSFQKGMTFCRSIYVKKGMKLLAFIFEKSSYAKIVSEYDQEIPQSQTADNPVAPRGRAAQPSRDTRKTN